MEKTINDYLSFSKSRQSAQISCRTIRVPQNLAYRHNKCSENANKTIYAAIKQKILYVRVRILDSTLPAVHKRYEFQELLHIVGIFLGKLLDTQ